MADERKARRWLSFFQFSLRTTLIVVTGVCVWLAFVMERTRRQRQAVEEIRRNGDKVYYYYEVDKSSQRGTALARAWLGNDFFDDVYGVSFGDISEFWSYESRPLAPEELQRLKHFHRLKYLGISKIMSDEQIAEVAQIGTLERLILYQYDGSHEALVALIGNRPNLIVEAPTLYMRPRKSSDSD